MLRQFAGLWILFFGFLAWQAAWRGQATRAEILGVLAMTVGPLGLLWPAVIRPIFVAWLVLAFPIGWVVSRVLLFVLFFCVICPVGVVFRLMRRDALQLRRETQRKSYWMPKPEPNGLASYFRQF
jgi:hypothetical protein